jgi:hypothetical protein
MPRCKKPRHLNKVANLSLATINPQEQEHEEDDKHWTSDVSLSYFSACNFCSLKKQRKLQIAKDKNINNTACYMGPFRGLSLAGTQWRFKY